MARERRGFTEEGTGPHYTYVTAPKIGSTTQQPACELSGSRGLPEL